MRIIEILSGKKTYIVAFVIAALNLAVAFDLVTVEQLEQINLILVALGFGAVRSAISKG